MLKWAFWTVLKVAAVWWVLHLMRPADLGWDFWQHIGAATALFTVAYVEGRRDEGEWTRRIRKGT